MVNGLWEKVIDLSAGEKVIPAWEAMPVEVRRDLRQGLSIPSRRVKDTTSGVGKRSSTARSSRE